PITKKIKELFPKTITVWGGYFASNQYKSVIESGFVDYIVNGPGDTTFPSLLDAIESNDLDRLNDIENLIFKKSNEVVKTKKQTLLDQDKLPALPYKYLNEHYHLDNYLARTFLGNKTIAYHSSFGCPFTCSFCAVVPIYNARWKGKSAGNIYTDIKYLKENFGADAIEFHDNNFFVSEKRTVEFARLVMEDNMQWWGEARIDTMHKYTDESLQTISDAGCKMIFFGAETGNDDVLKSMNKGGTQTGQQIKDFAARLKKFNIIPEYSFVLGMPGETEAQVWKQIKEDVEFIKEIKAINPDTEIIIYVYSPVPTEGSELFEQVKSQGFQFPEKLEDWLDPTWEKFDLRKNPLTPWLTAEMVDYIKNFETVLNGFYPTISDIRIKGFKRSLIRNISKWRYRSSFYNAPYEIKALHKIWKYRQPEVQGFYSE
ncbi:MAG: B12-binding domain-containing radical SAM protein, partial [Flavobacteriales bacterium]|nr:B12-binding domain-containing radical SAM protein [Flavobacteriales bacterium]